MDTLFPGLGPPNSLMALPLLGEVGKARHCFYHGRRIYLTVSEYCIVAKITTGHSGL